MYLNSARGVLLHSRIRRNYSRLSAGCLAVSLLMLGTGFFVPVPTSASVSPKHKVALTPLKQGLAFYKGKQLTLVTASSAGTPVDVYGRALAQYMSIYLKATVTPSSGDTANGIPQQNEVASAIPNGLTLGILSPLGDIGRSLANILSIDFNPIREAFIASDGPQFVGVIASESSGIKSYTALLPGSNPNILTNSSGIANTIFHALFGVLGWPITWTQGYSNAPSLLAGFVRGDGPMMDTAWGSEDSFVVGNSNIHAVPIVLGSKIPAGVPDSKGLTGIPTVKTLLAKYPPKTQIKKKEYAAVLDLLANGDQPLFTQTGVKLPELLALRAAAAWSFKQPGFKDDLLNQALSDGYVNPVVAKTDYINALKVGKTVAQFLPAQ